jgi:hypothetical protein
MAKCSSSPTGEHEGETSEITITKKGKQVTVIRLVCRWCGKNMGK